MNLRRSKLQSWSAAQMFEFRHAKKYMDRLHIAELLQKANSRDFLVSSGYFDSSLVSEYFDGSLKDYKEFVLHITDKNVLEIGPCLLAQVASWDVARHRFAIEPLYEKISLEQRKRFGVDGYPNVTAYASAAENLISELVGTIDGAVLIRNCLDHSPKWAFIMANLSLYVTKGAQLLLWNDLSHPRHLRRGHYEICKEIDQFRNLILSLGWRVIFEFQKSESECVNYGCRAVKM
ncbi:MAG: hypothetical protein O3B03_02980 [Proteobacteria bacterium]|nr:hypothetical protein [Pseudomonadota bacterium]